MASCVPQSAAQLTVFDPANYQENLLSAARALEQINNQVRQLQNQALMILRMDQNLVRLGSTHRPTCSARSATSRPSSAPARASPCGCRRRKAATSRLFPRRSPRRSRPTTSLRNAKSRWDEEYAALQTRRPPARPDRRQHRRRHAPARRCHGPLEQCRRRPGGGAGRQRVDRLERQAGARSCRACSPRSTAPKRSQEPAISPPRTRRASASSPSSARARPTAAPAS